MTHDTHTQPPPPPPPSGYEWRKVEPAKGISVAALVCGIAGSAFGLVPIAFVVAWALGAVALVLGIVAWRTSRKAGARKPMAIWGTALGVLALVLGGVGYAIVDDAFGDLEGDLDEIDQDFQDEMDAIDDDTNIFDDYTPPTEAQISDATNEELWDMWGASPYESDIEARLQAELEARGEW